MDERLKKEIVDQIEKHGRWVAFEMRDTCHIVPSKVRVSVFFDKESAMLENELKIDVEQYEAEYQQYLKQSVIEEAKKIHKDAPQ